MSRIIFFANCLVILAISFFSSCSKDEGETCTGGSLSFSVDGDSWTAKSFNNTLIATDDAGTAGKRMDIRATAADGSQFILTITDLTNGTTGNCMSTTATYTAFNDISTGLENVFFFNFIDALGNPDAAYDGTLSITACNEDKKTISGTFSFTRIGDGAEGINGVFTDLCYRK